MMNFLIHFLWLCCGRYFYVGSATW